MNPDLVALIFGVLLAAFAGVMKLVKIYSARKHERLSVRPSLHVDREIQSDKPIRIVLQNSGVGPAFIDSFEILTDLNDSAEKIHSNLYSAITKLGLNGSDIICYSPTKDEEIPASCEKILFEANPINSQDHKKICTALPGLTFKINYSSVYDEKFSFKN